MNNETKEAIDGIWDMLVEIKNTRLEDIEDLDEAQANDKCEHSEGFYEVFRLMETKRLHDIEHILLLIYNMFPDYMSEAQKSEAERCLKAPVGWRM